MGDDNWKLLSELIEQAGLTVTFDSKRNITICVECGAKNPIRIENGQWIGSWLTRAPGYLENECRRLCDDCAKLMKHKIKVVKYTMDESLSWEERYRDLERHHQEETKYLISVIEKYEEETNQDEKGKTHCYCCDNSPI